jgi:DNA end-binding protein Ku
MPPRPIWRGHLRLALVSCPVALVAARHERANLHFNLINPDTGNRVRMVTLDAGTGEELERGKLVRGFETSKDRYVLLDDADFEQARIASSTVMTIDKFVPVGSIDPLYFDAGHLLLPDGEAGADVYAVLREAMARSATMALSRLVLARRERAVAVVAQGSGMVLHTLHEQADLTDRDAAFADVPDARPDPAMVKLAQELIARQTGEYDPAYTEDRYEARLRAVIAAKAEGMGVAPAAEDAPPDNVIDLMAALRRSLGKGGGAPDEPPDRPPGSRKPPMPRGDKSAYTDKQKRKAQHIEEGYRARGVPAAEAKGRAWATVNKDSGGGNRSGSGRGKPDTNAAAKQGAKKSAARPPAERSASARKAAATRRRRAAG